MKLFKSITVILSILIFINCSKDDNSEGGIEETPIKNEETIEKQTELILPDELKDEKIIITTPNESFEADNSIENNVNVTNSKKEIIFAENSNGDILLASLTNNNSLILSYESMAESMISLLPWTGRLSDSELTNILNEIKLFNEYLELVKRIEIVVKQNKSPLNDDTSINLLGQINSKITSAQVENKSQSIKNVPEVDYIVEPNLNYSSNQLTIRNDGLTTATWGVQIKNKKNEALSEYLMLEGNKVNFPSLSTLTDYFLKDKDYESIILSKPIKYSVDEKEPYIIDIKSPTILNRELAYNTALYNIYENFELILNAFGLELPSLPEINPSDFLNHQGCSKDLFANIYDSTIEALSKKQLDDEFLIDKAIGVIQTSIETIGDCTEMGKNIKNSNYLKKLAKFVNVYTKIQGAFKIGKLVGDMTVLSDINICRQFIKEKMYPCFTIEKNTVESVETDKYCPESEIELSIKTISNIVSQENTLPIGLEITWEYTDKNGNIKYDSSIVNSEGVAKFDYVTTESESQTIKALVKNSNNDVVSDILIFEIKKNDKDNIECFSTWTNNTPVRTDNNGYRIEIISGSLTIVNKVLDFSCEERTQHINHEGETIISYDKISGVINLNNYTKLDQNTWQKLLFNNEIRHTIIVSENQINITFEEKYEGIFNLFTKLQFKLDK